MEYIWQPIYFTISTKQHSKYILGRKIWNNMDEYNAFLDH
jgi:hypothetical protein